ncbi:hypothetical protein M436DRAFT_67670 [Aureobasidium namibiae CBS 147.97]|uniref:Uncharacterized protein n=1 Tax=Aureobasidium namibiae CBS 147.97 TaxID=1043004 RepID=A0A074WBN6_9PEZI
MTPRPQASPVASGQSNSQCPDSLHRDALKPASASGRDSGYLATKSRGPWSRSNLWFGIGFQSQSALLPDPPPSATANRSLAAAVLALVPLQQRPGSQPKSTFRQSLILLPAPATAR